MSPKEIHVMSEIAHVTPTDLHADMEYAQVVSSGAMLPAQYRGKPADILIAIGLGRSMGLSPAESLYRIHVIQGRPTASAELIAANVRKAGHRLRVIGNEQTARATIVRSDDPEFEFESVWTLDRAKALGLSGKDGWQKQPGTMMRWRAITEVARLACPEALYGVAYVAEEIGDLPRADDAPRVTAADFLRTEQPSEPAEDVHDAEVVETGEAPDPRRTRAMFASFRDAGWTDGRSAEDRARRLEYCSRVVGREVESSNDLTAAEVESVIAALKADAAEQDGAES